MAGYIPTSHLVLKCAVLAAVLCSNTTPLVKGQDVATPQNDERATVGPETEKRFPPLKVPDGFRATLVACDPLVEYPSVIAIGPTS